MKVERVLVLLSIAAVVLAASGIASADQKGVLAKIDEAEKAQGEAAATALEAAKGMVEADIAEASEYVKAIGGAIAGGLGSRAETAKAGGEAEQAPLDTVKDRVADLYGALMPAAKGDLAAAAAYIKGAVAGAPEGAKERLEASAAGAAAEDKDVAMKSVKVGVIQMHLSKALAAMNQGDRKTAIRLAKAAAEYLGQEAPFVGEAKAEVLDTAEMMRMSVDTIQRARGEEASALSESIIGMMDDVKAALSGAK